LKRIVILGSTGSIGTQTLEVVRTLPNQLSIVGLSARSNSALLQAQTEEFNVPSHSAILGTEFELENLCRNVDADVVVVSVAGAVGIRATIAALETGKDVALATKEVLVAAGEIVMAAAKANNRRIFPIDSEHSAIFQCLEGNSTRSVQRIQITGSGGPFREWAAERLKNATLAEALNHPTWPNMGKKITVDSATLMNKGLETIEAKWLFDLKPEQIQVIIHPQSIVHSMVQFVDGSIIAQLGPPDMRLPIAYALLYPERVDVGVPALDLAAYAKPLTFQEPDIERFPALGLARKAMEIGGSMPAVLNGANEASVQRFLGGTLTFAEIPIVVQTVMEKHIPIVQPQLDDIINADLWARKEAASFESSIQL
jgi:1-deoxy-D-xylulose-5-phosphate reductoisomerase